MKHSSLASLPVILLFCGAAAAQTPPDAAAPATVAVAPGGRSLAATLQGAAKQNYDSGKLLFVDGDAAGASVKFRNAYEESRDPRLLWNIAACEKNLHHYARALALVRQYRTESAAMLSPEDRSEADELVKVMEPFTSRLSLNVDQPGARVIIDDEEIGITPLVEPLVLDLGARKVVVRKEGFEDFTREVAVGNAAQVTLAVNLVKTVHEGRLTVHTSNGGSINLDGRVVGVGQWTGLVPSGGHTLRVTADGMRPYQSEVYVQDRQTRDVGVILEKEERRGGIPAWAWVVGGVVVAGGLSTAGYFLFKPVDRYEGPPGNLNPGIVQASTPIHLR